MILFANCARQPPAGVRNSFVAPQRDWVGVLLFRFGAA